MKCKNLSELIRKNCMCREFLLAQPIYIQVELHKIGDSIHTTEDLLSEISNLQYIAK